MYFYGFAFASCILPLLHGWLIFPTCLRVSGESRGEMGEHAGGTMGDSQGCTCKQEPTSWVKSGSWVSRGCATLENLLLTV